jgi:TetR/AcrR family transcriptional regulator
MTDVSQPPLEEAGAAPEPAGRKRPKPGERRIQILQALATMLEQPDAERVTTAALAKRLDVSEAALYRHFASKAQMYEGLLDFIEETVFTLINQINLNDPLDQETEGMSAAAALQAGEAGQRQASRVTAMLLQFAEKNPGMTRVMVGDALLGENERLQDRMNLFFDKVEATLRQCFRALAVAQGLPSPTVEAQMRASVVMAFVLGRLHRYARSGFRRLPTEHLDLSLRQLV